MRIAVVGGGGREHAIIKKIVENPEVSELYALPGNGGIAADAVCVPIAATDIDGIVDYCFKNKMDYVVVAPDDPLVLGAVDALHAAGIECFGPSKAAARIEGSKAFAKRLMLKYGIPTAAYEEFTEAGLALDYVKQAPLPLVVKADGLALGKGVIICHTREEAVRAVESMMLDRAFGGSGDHVVIEEFLTGPEVTVLAFTDGQTIVPMVSSMDHKRALDGDRGLNTGGMGTIAPSPFYTPEIAERCMREIYLPVVAAMREEGCPFAGCLYAGLMLTMDGPKVIEFNCRFGDPEAQVTLPLLKGDLLTIMRAVSAGRLAEASVEFAGGAAACVIVASGGYPEAYKKGCEVKINEVEGVTYYHAGTSLGEDGKIVYTSGGRVIGAGATGESLDEALKLAYEGARSVEFEDAYFRGDIGAAALAAGR